MLKVRPRLFTLTQRSASLVHQQRKETAMDVDQEPTSDTREVEGKRAWQAPRLTITEFDETKTEILAGTEIIIYVS